MGSQDTNLLTADTEDSDQTVDANADKCIRCMQISFGPGHVKTCLMSYANSKGADQPAHPRSLISTFIVRCLDSTMCILAIAKV